MALDIKELHGAARRLTLELREGVVRRPGAAAGRGGARASSALSSRRPARAQERLERYEGQVGAPPTLAASLQSKHAELARVARELEQQQRVLLMSEGAGRRDIWKHKVEQVVEETDQLRAALEKHTRREHRRQVEERERAELLQRVTDVEVNLGEADLEAQALASVNRSSSMVDDLLAHGTAILGSMAEQRDRIKSAQRRVLDVLNATGMSERLLKAAGDRQKQDALLVYGGIAAITFFALLLWFRFG